MADYSLANPTPLSRVVQTVVPNAGQKSQIEQITGLLKEVNSVAPHVKELVAMFKGDKGIPAGDPQGLRSSPPPSRPQNEEPRVRVVEKTVMVQPQPEELFDQFVNGMKEIEKIIGPDMPFGGAIEWTTKNKLGLVQAMKMRGGQLNPSPSPTTLPPANPEN